MVAKEKSTGQGTQGWPLEVKCMCTEMASGYGQGLLHELGVSVCVKSSNVLDVDI